MGFFKNLGKKNCLGCNKTIEDGEKHYIEYPSDAYCLKCAENRPDYNR